MARNLEGMTDADLRLYVRALEVEVEAERTRAVRNAELARVHFLARQRFEARAASARRDGFLAAVRWLRDMPRIEIVIGRVRLGEEVVRHTLTVAARRLEERLAATEEETKPDLLAGIEPEPPSTQGR